MRRLKHILLVAAACGLAVPLQAAWTPAVHHFKPDAYGGGTQNWAVVQQDNGWIYAANNYGLLEYDGSAWNLYGVNNSTAVRSVARGSDGTIYAGATDEFGVFAPNERGELVYRSLADSLPPRYRQFGEVWGLHCTDGQLYVQTRNYIFIADLNGHVEVIDPSVIIHTSLLVDGDLYIATSRDLYVLSGNRLHALRGAEVLHGALVAALVPYGEHGVLIGTAFQGVWLYDGDRIRSFRTEADAYIRSNQLYTMAVSDRYIAFGTVRKGVVWTDMDGRNCRYMTREDGLQNNTILSLCFDRQGNLWMGLDNGIDYIQTVAPILQLHDRNTDYGSGYSACEYRGTLYLGTNQGLYRQTQDGSLRLVTGSLGQVWNVAEAGGTLFCCHNRGLFVVEDGRLQPLECSDGVWSVRPLAGNRAIAGGYTGFYLLQQTNRQWQAHYLEGFHETALYYDIDATGRIWVLSSRGVERLTIDSARHRVTGELVVRQPAAQRTYSIARSGNELWLTGNRYCGIIDSMGVLREDAAAADRLSGVRRYVLIHRDGQGNVWYMYDGRLNVRRHTDSIPALGATCEVLHNPKLFIGGFANIAFLHDGDAVVGGVNGFYRLNGEQPAFAAENLYIRRVTTAQNRQVVYGESYAGEAAALKLPAGVYSLCVHLSGNDVTRDNVLYRTRLLPGEKDFTEWRDTPVRDLIAVHPGEYLLEVEMLSRSDRVIARTLPIQIRMPFYRTAGAKAVYALLLLAGIALAVWRIRRRMQAGKQRIAREKNEEIRQQQVRILQLENEKAQFDLQNKSRELSRALLTEANRKEWNSEVLSEIRRAVDCLNDNKVVEARGRMQNLQNRLSRNSESSVDWKRFEENFDMVNNQFVTRLKTAYPWMTKQERKLCVYIRMGLLTKEIAPLMNISVRGVEMMRYRLRTKMNLEAHTDLHRFFNAL